MFKSILFIFISFYVFVGCSQKQYFEPENTAGNYPTSTKSSNSAITFVTSNGATLENYRSVTKDGISKITMPKNYHFLNKVNEEILASDNDGHIFLGDNKNIITFKKNVVAASVNKELLALLFIDNSIALYDLNSKKFKFKEYDKFSFVNNTKIANPMFLDDLVIFPTLNGKLIIVNKDTFKEVKAISIDPDNQVNNIIHLSTIGNTMVAATANKILTLGEGKLTIKDYSISNVTTTNDAIFVSTIEGNIVKLSLSLQELAKKKFKFSKIVALGYGSDLYALESQGFLIKLNKTFTKNTIYEVDFDIKSKVIGIKNILYFDDKYLELN